MADLLECVIQIKALGAALGTAIGARSTSGLVSAELQGVSVWQRMTDAERRYALALGAAGADIVHSGDDAPAARADFASLRRANLAMLDRCTAAELAGVVEWPGRPSTTVADLVAIMLANDTEALGELRRDGARRLPSPAPVEGSDVEGGLREPGRGASKGASPGAS
jgi:hypothetical protein